VHTHGLNPEHAAHVAHLEQLRQKHADTFPPAPPSGSVTERYFKGERAARWRERHGMYGRRKRRPGDPLPAKEIAPHELEERRL
jgi:hypothetical protein